MKEDWVNYFLDIALAVSKRASCPRRSHGCVIVNSNKTIITCGYNGAPIGCRTCKEDGCLMLHNHCKRAEHAERNALFRAAMEGHSVNNCSAFITGAPCFECLRGLLAAGIKEIYFIEGGHYNYPEEEENIRQTFLRNSNVLYKTIKR